MKFILEKLKQLIGRNLPVFFIGGLTIVIFLVIIVTSSRRSLKNTNLIEVEMDDLTAPHTYSKGPTGARVQVVEFSDFGCPACKTFHPIMTKIFNDYSNDIRWSFRHFPLPQHKDSDIASVAAQAAGEQGKFWEYADILFENQGDFSREKLISYADLLGLNLDKFTSNNDNSTFKEIINDDIAYGKKIGINATPTFFVNGKQVSIKNQDDLRKVIEDALNLTNTENVPESTQSGQEESTAHVVDPQLIALYKTMDEKYGVVEIKYSKEDGFTPRNTEAQAGQLVRWINTTDQDVKFIQLMPKFDEFKQPKIIKAGETLEYRLRLREKGLWTYNIEGNKTRGSILIMGINAAYKDLVEIEKD
ncbi:hypothetical protein A2V49_01695 [candidate division WWE3 bacterium RBG_19FT_COMBO_34_6]|uniref:Thioredoxin domain-containing protein n=1 Tax=candidate division WWE3 bacterium RBG_19FT_COMBO_34_6 TaxID=1802612 RepID=A0A1F4UK45_UNCKA|nr:MAG: hypothetical protein A2V49_01695 [candidate division WWE3 bacterium RBG_19FT_COMBO_34_6]